MRKALIEIATGRVTNVIEINPDDGGGYGHYPLAAGIEMVDAVGAEVGGQWDGKEFTPPVVEPSRLDVLRNKLINGNGLTEEETLEALRISLG